MLALAIFNGALREYSYGKQLSELAAHQLSSIAAVILFSIYTYFFYSMVPLHSVEESMLTGLIWLVMTVCFEFLFGHYYVGHPWKTLLADYNLFQGRLWPLVLIAISTLPALMRFLQNSQILQ